MGGRTVGHMMRAYLSRTETFVYNQIASLHRYRPVVVARHRRPVIDFPLDERLRRGSVRMAAALLRRSSLT